MIRRLHPTAALGVWPRTEAGERWLREADRGVKRRTFGAPFGLEREDHSALAVVGIRNLQLSGDRVRVGAGAGLLSESRLQREFDELALRLARAVMCPAPPTPSTRPTTDSSGASTHRR